MRLGGRLAGAIEVLGDIETRRRPVADCLKDWGLAHRFAGSGDRAAIGNIVYDALRMKASHAYMMDDDSPTALAYAVLLRQWGYSPESLASALDGDTYAPAPLSESQIATYQARDLDAAPLNVQGDIPDWVQPSFEAAFGDTWLTEAKALALRPSLDLRVNTLKAKREKVLKALDRSGARPAPISPLGLRIEAGDGPSRLPNVTAEVAFEKGWFEVQDEGSQLVSALVEPSDNDQVLDFCAGGGGKTLAMAAAMHNKGQVHAFDSDRKRLAPIIERLKRAGTHNVQVHDNITALKNLLGHFSKVLVDAPCTGTGTWRRRPDTKWRLTDRSLQERVEQQRDALNEAATYVRPGGELIYVTCSVLPEENDRQIDAFLESHPDFKPVAMMERWSVVVGDMVVKPVSVNGKSLTLSPATTGTDGFFFSKLKRAN